MYLLVENLYEITSEVRKKLQDLLDDLMDSLDLDELDNNQEPTSGKVHTSSNTITIVGSRTPLSS